MEDKYTHFDRHYDVDGMLHENAIWLGMQVERPLKKFLKVANELDLRQEDWDIFWKKVRDII
jgi:hypothetical protein